MSLFGKDNHIVLWWLLLGTLCSNSAEVCQLPSPLQSSSWNYTDNSRELILAFGTSTMSGFKYRFRGEDIESYDCISNTSNVYVFKSQDTFSKRGVANHVYACMKMTMVSSNLFYFYLLADTDNSILPNPERLYIANNGLSDDFPTCNYCQYTTSPPDDDFRILRRSGQISEDLSGNVSLCLPCNAKCTSNVECAYPDTIDNGTVVITGNNTGDTITYNCSNGYEEAGGNSTRVCQDDGSWSGSPLTCSPVSCGTLPVVSHTANDTTGTDYDDTVSYTCISGYEKTSGNLHRTCQADKTWSGSPPVCSPVSCGALPVVSHTANDTTGTDYSDTITYTCLSGYEKTSGNLVRTCQAVKAWSGSSPVCSPVSCGSLGAVLHATNVPTGIYYTDTITYTCVSGYEHTSGTFIRTCQASKTWNGYPPMCTPVSCGSLGAVSHATNVPTGIYYTDTITYTCVSGYEHTSGTLIRTCQASKNWNGSPPVCTRMCPDPGLVKNAQRRLNGNNPLDTVVYTCNSGFQRFSGDLFRECQANGVWSGDDLVCHAVQSISNEQVSMITAGTIAGSILLFGIVFMVVVSCLICGVKRRNKDRVLKSKTRSRKTQSYSQNVYNM